MLALGLALLAKIVLRVSVADYGFALALPGTVMLLTALLGWGPRAVETRGGTGWPMRAAALFGAGALVFFGVVVSESHMAQVVRPLGSGPDAFLVDERAEALSAALAYIERHTTPDDTLLVLPEGAMLNFLARRESPTPYINFMPPELAMFGPERMLSALRDNPPDLVALVHRESGEYGLPFFGRDYGEPFMDWLEEHYRPAARFGQPPLQRPRQFGVLILEPR